MRVEPLSPEDATIWCAQAADAPLQLGGLALCQAAALQDESGAIPIDRLRRHVEARLSDAPRFHQVLRPLPFGQGPVWVDDDHFDIARHLRLAALPRPGREAQLREFVARRLEEPFPTDRSPWELWVVEGVAGDRVALLPRVSHVLGDGMAVLGVVLSLFDVGPQEHQEPPSPPRVTVEPPPALSMLASAAWQRRRRQAAALGQLGRSFARPGELPRRAVSLVRAGVSLLTPAPALPVTRPVGPRRDFAWVTLPLAGLEQVKRAHEVKLNDVVLAVVTGAVSRYVEQVGAHTDRVRVVVPVSTHGVDLAGEVENRFTMMFVNLDGTADPVERLRKVAAETRRVKRSLQANLGGTVLTLAGVVPQRMLRAVAPRLLHHQPFVNVVVTNLTGPRRPLYLLGSRLLAMYPFVTVTANLGVTFGVVSYAGTLGIGITVDADAVPDVVMLARAVEDAADDLLQAGAPTYA